MESQEDPNLILHGDNILNEFKSNLVDYFLHNYDITNEGGFLKAPFEADPDVTEGSDKKPYIHVTVLKNSVDTHGDPIVQEHIYQGHYMTVDGKPGIRYKDIDGTIITVPVINLFKGNDISEINKLRFFIIRIDGVKLTHRDLLSKQINLPGLTKKFKMTNRYYFENMKANNIPRRFYRFDSEGRMVIVPYVKPPLPDFPSSKKQRTQYFGTKSTRKISLKWINTSLKYLKGC
jgi:hypothetical protein